MNLQEQKYNFFELGRAYFRLATKRTDQSNQCEYVKYPTLKGWACRELSPTSQL